MSISVMNWVWDHSRSRHGARLVLLAIADRAGDNGNADVSVLELARKAFLSERAVQMATRELAAMGELVIAYNGGHAGRNSYRVVMNVRLRRLAVVKPPERPPIPIGVRLSVFGRDGYRCADCGSTEDLTLDHIHPWSRGGSDTEDNLRVLCRSCNSRKGARP